MKIEGTTTLVVLIVSLCLVVPDAEAGWKFWKKKDKETTPPPETTTITTTTTTTTAAPPRSRPGSPTNTGSAILGAADPGLAVGVGSSGQDIRTNARPSRPNPGTEVGLDFPSSRPSRPGTGGTSGQGYRDWAADLTGAGEPGRQSPKLPAQGPALTAGDTRPASVPGGTPAQPQPGSRPASVPGGIPSQPGQPQSPGARPAGPAAIQPQTPGSPTPSPRPAGGQPQPGSNAGGGQVSTLNVGTLRPGGATTPSPSRPGSQPGSPSSGYPALPGSPTARPGSPNQPGSPQPGRSWADVAGGGSRPGSPTPAPRQPGQPGQTAPGQTPRPGTTRPTMAPIRPWSGAGGAVAGGAVAGAAAGAAAGAGSGTTTTSNGKTYSSNPTYSKGNTITDEDLEKLSEALFIKDTNNANGHITVNLQKQTTSSSPTDEAPQPLFTVNQQAYQIPTIERVISLFDNYQLDTHTNEYISPAQRQEESLLVDTFLSTNVMSAAMRFLADKGNIRKDYYEYKDTLRKLWFNLFSRGQGKIGSTGFEHVFMTEIKPGSPGPEVLGLHNWIYYSLEEAKRRADYLGYIKKVDLGNKASIVKIHTKFNGHDKPVTTMFVGTSPELEMALYTVCFYARPDANCPVSLGGTKFNIVTHKFKYRGNDLVGTAYPDI